MSYNESGGASYLLSLINKTLRIHTTDTRIFVGQMKCTDKDRNIILSLTHEYRHPPLSTIQDAAADAIRANAPEQPESRASSNNSDSGNSIKVDMIRRFVGLVVVPGQYITKIEVED